MYCSTTSSPCTTILLYRLSTIQLHSTFCKHPHQSISIIMNISLYLCFSTKPGEHSTHYLPSLSSTSSTFQLRSYSTLPRALLVPSLVIPSVLLKNYNNQVPLHRLDQSPEELQTCDNPCAMTFSLSISTFQNSIFQEPRIN